MAKKKFHLRKISVRWFCRNCHQKGLAAISMHIKTDTVPTIPEILAMIETTCHTDCDEPDIRFHHDTTKTVH